MAPSIKKGSVCSMTAGLSVLMYEGTMLKNDCICFSKTNYLRLRTYVDVLPSSARGLH